VVSLRLVFADDCGEITKNGWGRLFVNATSQPATSLAIFSALTPLVHSKTPMP
jgi:hypothetical protein